MGHTKEKHRLMEMSVEYRSQIADLHHHESWRLEMREMSNGTLILKHKNNDDIMFIQKRLIGILKNAKGSSLLDFLFLRNSIEIQ